MPSVAGSRMLVWRGAAWTPVIDAQRVSVVITTFRWQATKVGLYSIPRGISTRVKPTTLNAPAKWMGAQENQETLSEMGDLDENSAFESLRDSTCTVSERI